MTKQFRQAHPHHTKRPQSSKPHARQNGLGASAADRIRALRFIVEQNRLLQRDNKALIGMVQRLRAELDEKNGGAAKSGAKSGKQGTKGAKACKQR